MLQRNLPQSPMREAYFTLNPPRAVPVADNWKVCIQQIPTGVSNDRIVLYLAMVRDLPRFLTYGTLVVLARQVKPSP